MSIVVANRLPAEGVKSIIHLVSLEGRYKQNGADFVFDFDGYGEAIPLVSLHNWSFTALTEKETFRHILLHLNHEFLFSLDAQQLPAEPSIDHLRNSFLTGGNPLSSQALVADVAVKEARDKDHCYYVGKQGALYNAAGRRVAAGNGIIPANKDQFATWFPGLRLHSKTATYANVTARQLWVGDGDKLYFVSEDPVSYTHLDVYKRQTKRVVSGQWPVTSQRRRGSHAQQMRGRRMRGRRLRRQLRRHPSRPWSHLSR